MSAYDPIAALYDAAFAWESDPEVILPLYRHMGSPARVLEVCCGPARLLETLVAHGAHGTGIDISPAMLALARERFARLPADRYRLTEGDLTRDAPGSSFAGAFCAVGSFGHFDSAAKAAAHLALMYEALEPGALYAVQLGLKPLRDTGPRGPNEHSGWTFEIGAEQARYAWYGLGIDAAAQRETQVSEIEWLCGPRAGEIVRTEHPMRIWDWPHWCEAAETAGFEQVASLDPNDGFAELPLGEALYDHPVAWHLLRRR